MPKEAAYTLAWSVAHQIYTLYDLYAEATFTFDEASPVWRERLEQVTSFPTAAPRCWRSCALDHSSRLAGASGGVSID
jgi:hypothetical protein